MKKILIFCTCLLAGKLLAQPVGSGIRRIITGPSGVCIPLFGDGLPKVVPGDALIIYRQDGAGASMKKIATVSVPANARNLDKQTRLPDSMRLNLAAWEAMGWVYVDRTPGISSKSPQYEIRLLHGNIEQTFYREQVIPGDMAPLPKFRVYRKSYIDSNLVMTWYALDKRFIQARLQLRDHQQRSLVGNDAILGSYHQRDTMFLTYSGPLLPGALVVANIRAVDIAGNSGPVSDTLRIMAAGMPAVRQLDSLRVVDTVNNITLRWKPLPFAAQYAGIRVLKSRSPDGPFTTLDTVPSTEQTYRDQQVIPGTQYYYVLHPMLPVTNESVEPALSMISAVALGGGALQEQPQQVRLQEQADGTLRISWKPVASLDVDAYYVLRGNSTDSMAIIASAIRDTVFIDSIQMLDPTKTTHYAVMALKTDMQWSDTSHIVSFQSSRGRFVAAPGGLSIRSYGGLNQLLWEDVRSTDPAIAGYMIYRRKKGESAFRRITQLPVKGNAFSDSIGPGGSWEYACASVDFWGNQSLLSPTAISDAMNAGNLAIPPGFSLIRQPKGIAILIERQAFPAEPGLRYRLYRRIVDTREAPLLLGELTVQDRQWIDTRAPQGKLLAYVLKTVQNGKESDVKTEKTIRND